MTDPRETFMVIGHKPESVIFDETWKIVCVCGWECWDVEDEEKAWETFNDHVFDDVNTALRLLRDGAKVTSLG